jgi:hypothetical protein
MSFLEKHYNRLVVNLRDDVPPIAETLDVFPKGLSFLLDNAS